MFVQKQFLFLFQLHCIKNKGETNRRRFYLTSSAGIDFSLVTKGRLYLETFLEYKYQYSNNYNRGLAYGFVLGFKVVDY